MFIFSSAQWTTVLAQAAGVAAVLFGAYKWTKKHDPALIKEIPAAIQGDISAVEHVAGDLATSPWFAGVAAAGKIEAHHILGVLGTQKLATLVSQALAASGGVWASLSPVEQAAALSQIEAELRAVNAPFTVAEIESAIKTAETAIATLAPKMADAKRLSDAITKTA